MDAKGRSHWASPNEPSSFASLVLFAFFNVVGQDDILRSARMARMLEALEAAFGVAFERGDVKGWDKLTSSAEVEERTLRYLKDQGAEAHVLMTQKDR